MADQSTELRRINWSECFAFTHIFRTFRLAIHPSKLVLALAGLLLTGLSGWVLDGIWSAKYTPAAGEINAFWQTASIDAWRERALTSHANVVKDAYEQMKVEAPANLVDEFHSNPHRVVKDALGKLDEQYEAATRGLEDENEIAKKAREFNGIHAQLVPVRPKGVFRSLLVFETDVVRQLLEAARGLNFTGGISEVFSARVQGARAEIQPIRTDPDGFGVLTCVVLMIRGAQWLWVEHPLFALLLGIDVLAIWALFGGAICRMAALNTARDERIGLKSAVGFAVRKYVGFLTAPLLPVILVLVVGVCLIVGGAVGAIPGVGDLIAGLGMGLALVGGFVMALVIVGALGGGCLLWPTIAVEGSDGFDAMSRSYSYVYSRPWRMGFYTAVALVYGALCYLFARFFLWVVFKASRVFVGIGMGWFTSRPGTGSVEASKLDAIWRQPAFENLIAPVPPFGMQGADGLGWFLFHIWLFLAVLTLCAFLVTFYFSASTIVYYLLRREVDATDLEDVYLDEDLEDGEVPSAPAPPAGEDRGASLPVVEGTPPAGATAEKPASPSSDKPEPEGPEASQTKPKGSSGSSKRTNDDRDKDRDEDKDGDKEGEQPSS